MLELSPILLVIKNWLGGGHARDCVPGLLLVTWTGDLLFCTYDI